MNSAIRARLDNLRQHKSVASSEALFPYLLLAILAGSQFASAAERGTRLMVDVALCVITVAWMLGMYTLNPARRRPRPAAVFICGLLVLTAILTLRSGWFGFFIVVSFGYSRELLRWPWPMTVGAACAVIAALSATDGSHSSLPIHLMVFLVALIIYMLLLPAFMWLLHDREEQVVQHRKSLTELGEMNRRLEATIAENDVLHQQLLVQAREAGIFDERRRMAREIHDTIAQGLTGIVTQLQAAERAADQSPADPAGWRRHVTAATRLARESLTEARRSVDALRPEPLEGCPAERGAYQRHRAVVRAERDRGTGDDHGHGATGRPGGGIRAVAGRAGGTGERGQARARDADRPDHFLYGKRGCVGRARRRGGL